MYIYEKHTYVLAETAHFKNDQKILLWEKWNVEKNALNLL